MQIESIEFRTLDYADDAEVLEYLRLFWAVPEEFNDYFTRRSEAFIQDWVKSARATENANNTFSGIALHDGKIVGVHIVRRFHELELIGAHIAGLWVHPQYRSSGIARTLKGNGEAWAKSVGATFMNTNIQVGNDRMMAINMRAGCKVFRHNFRKRLL